MTAPTGERRRARERALGLLYEAEAKGQSGGEVLAELPVAPDPYARGLVVGVGRRSEQIDLLVRSHASGWALERMPAVDRQLLRLAAYELLAEPSVPVAVVIDEAVELAKQFSTEESGRYVNGVLAAIAREVRPETAAAAPDPSGAPADETAGAPAGAGDGDPAPGRAADAAADSHPAPVQADDPDPSPPGRRKVPPGAVGGVRARPR